VLSSTREDAIATLVKNASRFRIGVDHVEFPAEPGAFWQGPTVRLRETSE
jgi:hypothetical protein